MGQDSAASMIDLMLMGSFSGPGWQGTTLMGSLRGITAEQALWRPGRGRKCIWNHVLHASYWKHSVARILAKGTAAAVEVPNFDRSPSNWPSVPTRADEKLWKQDRALLREMHELLVGVAGKVDPEKLNQRPAPAYRWTMAQYLAGVAAHDAYHTGQVQLLKRLRSDSYTPSRH